jgi:putative redox protein
MAVQIDVRYLGDLHCEATHGPSACRLTTDAPTDNGGKGEAFSPTDLVATAFGTCLMTVMGLVAARHALDLAGTTVHVEKEMTAVPIRRIGALTVAVRFPQGRAFSEDDRRTLECTARSCPVLQSLHPDVKIGLTFEYA